MVWEAVDGLNFWQKTFNVTPGSFQFTRTRLQIAKCMIPNKANLFMLSQASSTAEGPLTCADEELWLPSVDDTQVILQVSREIYSLYTLFVVLSSRLNPSFLLESTQAPGFHVCVRCRRR